MEYKRIKVEMKDTIAILTLNHPEALNAITARMLFELRDIVGKLNDASSEARCLLITGAGRGFCSGANLTDPDQVPPEPNSGDSMDSTHNPLFLQLRDLRIPIVTAVNGPAAGVGMSLALMGDIVLAGRSAYFFQAFRQIGLIPDGGATYILPRLVGLARALELSLLAEKLPAQKALDWGLINRVYDDERLIPEAMELAASLASGPTIALNLMRKAYWQSMDNTYEQQLHLEAVLQLQALATEDATEGRMAFYQKRKPLFSGK